MRTQSYNNPLLGMMFQGATAQPSSYFPQYQPNPWGSLLQTGAEGLTGLFKELLNRPSTATVPYNNGYWGAPYFPQS